MKVGTNKPGSARLRCISKCGVSGKARSGRRVSPPRRKTHQSQNSLRSPQRQPNAKRFSVIGPQRKLSEQGRCRRIAVLRGTLIFFGGVVFLRVCQLQAVEHNKWLELALKQHRATVEVSQARGAIVDRVGRPLAVSIPSVSLAAHPRKIGDKHAASRTLAPVVGLSEEEVLELLSQSKPFVWLKRDLPFKTADRVGALGIDGVSAFHEYQRFYPQGALANFILGRTGRDGYGLAGAELAFEKRLSFGNVRISVRRDARGQLVADGDSPKLDRYAEINNLQSLERGDYLWSAALTDSEEPEADFSPYNNSIVRLSLDAALQGILEEELAAGLSASKASRVLGVVMDADSGEVLAMAEQVEIRDSGTAELSPESLRNAVIQDNFEPGSTLKPFVAAAALEEGVVSAEERMNCEDGEYVFANHVVHDAHPVGKATFREALVRSSNICLAKVGNRLGAARLHQALARFGLGEKPGIELPGESGGILRPLSKWAKIDVATHSFGHGVSVTALQLVRAYSALVNGGWLVNPTILKRDKIETFDAERVLSNNVSEQIREMLYDVTTDEHGTGRRAKIMGARVAGKTGTAHKPSSSGRGYDSNKVLASFVGFVDGRELGVGRRLTALVLVDEPQVRPRWGGVVAAPVFSRIMERVLSHLLATETKGVKIARANGGDIDV